MAKRMNKKWKDLWVRALLGGNFIQGRSALRQSGNECCCLGVLCDLVDPEGWDKDRPYPDSEYKHNGQHGYPVDAVLKKVGLGNRMMKSLAKMNDNGASFEDIAKCIKRDL